MTLKEFITYIFNVVHDLNNYSLVVRNKDYKENGCGPWIEIHEVNLEEPLGGVFIINLPDDLKIVRR